MTREEFIEKIRKEERSWQDDPDNTILIREAIELADGVIAVFYTVNDIKAYYAVFFENAKWQIREYSLYVDVSLDFDSFPEDMGLVLCAVAKNWEDISKTARENLETVEKEMSIRWHERPVKIGY